MSITRVPSLSRASWEGVGVTQLKRSEHVQMRFGPPTAPPAAAPPAAAWALRTLSEAPTFRGSSFVIAGSVQPSVNPNKGRRHRPRPLRTDLPICQGQNHRSPSRTPAQRSKQASALPLMRAIERHRGCQAPLPVLRRCPGHPLVSHRLLRTMKCTCSSSSASANGIGNEIATTP